MGIPGVGMPPRALEGDWSPVALPYTPVSLWHRSLGLVPRSSKMLTLTLRILWGPASYTPEPPRSDASCVWSQTCKPRSDFSRKELATPELCSGCGVVWVLSGVV